MTAIEWLVDQMFKQGYFDGNKPLSITNLDHLQHQAKQMEEQQKRDACGLALSKLLYDQALKSQISDEEIENFVNKELKSDEGRILFKMGAKWYREQLKKKQ